MIPASNSVHCRTGFIQEPVTSRFRRQLCKRPSAVELLSPPGFLPSSQIVINLRKMEFQLQVRFNTDRQHIQVRFQPSGAPLKPRLIRNNLLFPTRTIAMLREQVACSFRETGITPSAPGRG